MAQRRRASIRDLIRDLAALLRETDLTRDRDRARRSARPRLARSAGAEDDPGRGAARRPAEPARRGRRRREAASRSRAPSGRRAVADGRHRLPSPDAGQPAFVEVGDAVKQGQTILIIEAMKHMNEIAVAARREGDVDPRRGRPAGRVRRAADDHRLADPARHVLEGPDREPRRNRPPHPARLQGTRHPDRRDPLDGRRERDACAPGRRERLHRAAAGDDSYLNIPSIIAACEITGADAVHPGYGFLSENARFAEILAAHDVTFIGPSAEHIRIMGDKIKAKETAVRLGIPVVPGSDGRGRATTTRRAASPPRSAIR